MGTWVDIGEAGTLAEGEQRVVKLAAGSVLVVRLGGEVYAVENVCTHDGGNLAGGRVDAAQATVTCPRHGARFCLKSGRVLRPPAFEDLECYPVRIREGRVELYDEPQG